MFPCVKSERGRTIRVFRSNEAYRALFCKDEHQKTDHCLRNPLFLRLGHAPCFQVCITPAFCKKAACSTSIRALIIVGYFGEKKSITSKQKKINVHLDEYLGITAITTPDGYSNNLNLAKLSPLLKQLRHTALMLFIPKTVLQTTIVKEWQNQVILTASTTISPLFSATRALR